MSDFQFHCEHLQKWFDEVQSEKLRQCDASKRMVPPAEMLT